jgi:hypothetical protein
MKKHRQAARSPAVVVPQAAPPTIDRSEKSTSFRTATCAVLFLLLAPLVFHLLFSWAGFNPTDDGVVLAGSRRLLDGQVPHRDFIAIRPAGSLLLHVPTLWIGGDSCLWLGRYVVWLEFAIIAWAWTSIVHCLFDRPFSDMERVLIALTGLALAVHTYPLMPWTTIDGLCLASIGFWLRLRSSGMAGKVGGYVLLGAACLCRQAFVPLVPAALLFLGDWRTIRFWVAAAAPAVLYVLYLATHGAIDDAMVQFSSRSELVTVGLSRYFFHILVPWGVILGYVGLRTILSSTPWKILPNRFAALPKLLAMTALCAAMGLCALSIGIATMREVSFLLFAVALGCFGCLVEKQGWRSKRILAGLLVLATAWCVSISFGYNSPALACGALAPFLMACVGMAGATGDLGALGRRVNCGLAIVLAIASVAILQKGRLQFSYRDRSAAELKQPLGEVLAGGNHIRTNETTYAFLGDLRAAVQQCGKREYAVIPDLPAWWIRSPQRNPLAIDWAYFGELPSQPLLDRVIREAEAKRGHLVVIVQKISAAALGGQESPDFPEEDDFRTHIAKTWRKTGETRFFLLYE